jgi:hypothetical protein
MMSDLSRSIVRGALLILAVAAAGCVAEAGEPTAAEALAQEAAEAPAASAERAEAGDVVVADVVPIWAREDRMAEDSLRELLAGLAQRAASGVAADDRAAPREAAGWEEAL